MRRSNEPALPKSAGTFPFWILGFFLAFAFEFLVPFALTGEAPAFGG
jgi:ABC-type uncharacterized transport system permease subunit